MRNVVLLALRDQEVAEGLVDKLEAAGFSCLLAESGSAALATAQSYKPQLAVLHADLPEVQGTDVCLRLKQEPATQGIAVLLIGKDAAQERFVGTEVGADAYLAEPCTDDVVGEKIREMFSTLLLNAR